MNHYPMIMVIFQRIRNPILIGSLTSPREWRSYDPDAIAGLIYGRNNSKNNEIELFELKRTNISYSYFPGDKNDNEDWHYLGYIERNPS